MPRWLSKITSNLNASNDHDMINLEKIKEEVYHINVPDYSKTESINRLPTATSTWTIDRDGFIKTILVVQPTAGGVGTNILVNGIILDRLYGTGSASDHNIFEVHKGDVLSYEDTYNVQNAVYYIPPVKIPVPKYPSDLLPDYSAIENTINRIDTDEGTWIVDRDGFVSCNVNSSDYSIFFINDIEVSVGYKNHLGIFRVKQGDIVKIISHSTANLIWCYYIPPQITIPPYVNENISTTEIIDTGKTLDGKPIKRVAYEGLGATATRTWKKIFNVPNIDKIISVTGSLYDNDGINPIITDDTTSISTILYCKVASSKMPRNAVHGDFFHWVDYSGMINRQILVIIEYVEA
jgi:hypothetical protein